MRLNLLAAVLLCAAFTTLAQEKRPLNTDDYGIWERIGNRGLSIDGKWAYFEVTTSKSDGYLEVHELDGARKFNIPRGTEGEFSQDGGFFVCMIQPAYNTIRQLKLDDVDADEHPKDTLVILDLTTGEMEKIERVQSYQMPSEAANFFVYQHHTPLPLEPDTTEEVGEKLDEDSTAVEKPEDPSERPGYELVVRSFNGDTEHRILQTADYELVDFGAYTYFMRETEDTLHDDGLYVVENESGLVTMIDTSSEEIESFVPDADGKRLLYLATQDSSEADIQFFSAYLYEPGKEAKLLADTTTKGLADGWMLSTSGSPKWMEDGRFLFLEVAPRPKIYEEDSTKLDDEKVSVDVWSWTDPDIQPYQKENAGQAKNKSYTARYSFRENRLIMIENKSTPDVYINLESEHAIAMGDADDKYRAMRSYAYPWLTDYYMVDLRTGERILSAEAIGFGADISEGGNYMAYYSQRDSSWHVYDRIGSRDLIVDEGANVAWYDEEDDHPASPYPYGTMGWSKCDKRLYVYDRYDIWALDPLGKEEPVCVTNGFGRKNKITLRYETNDPEETFRPKGDWLLSAFNEETKSEGFYRLGKLGDDPSELTMLDVRFGWPRSSEETSRMLITKETFTESPDLYWTDGDFTNLKKLSSINPQQSEISWGSVELTSWRSNHGELLEGLIYKPENFDPNKEYPMIVYFYETYSDNVHRYYTPGPSRSIVNFSYLVSHDYVVFVPDIVYRDGYPGPSSYDCIIPGVQHMINQGYVDAARIGVQGQSWGGYQTAYLVTQTDIFAAGFAGAPVSNMTSAYGGIRWGSGLSRQFQYERSQSRIGGTLWDYPERYIENSPVFFADRVNTPLLIMHNDEDGAVPWYQGIEYFMALRRNNKPVWMLVYNGEAHNLREWHNRMDLDQRMYQFFDHYLKGAAAPVWMTDGVPAKVKGKEYGLELSE